MINVNFFVTLNDDGLEKYIITVDGDVAEIAATSAEDLGTLIKEAISEPPVAI